MREFTGVEVDQLRDEYRHAREQLVEAKVSGGELAAPPEPGPTVDLMAALGETVQGAEERADAVTVLRRDGTCLYRNTRTSAGDWADEPRAREIVTAEQQRPYTEQEALGFLALQQRLPFMLPQHREEIAQTTRLPRPLLTQHLQPRRLAGGAASAPLPLPTRYFPSGTSESQFSLRAS
ncbi:hypothetical protein ABZT45_49265 [Streptomyces sp. NPDC005356]|uniref:hypothetical protein n=1 Tax=unclassified Streptomyces TaxID=2593676 RepID=UPI0033A0F57D